MGRMFHRPRIPGDPRQVPAGIVVDGNGEVVTIRYRWGDGWSVLMLVCFVIAATFLALDAITGRATYPLRPAAVAAYCVVPAGTYGLLLHAFNSTVYTLRRAGISSKHGPLPSLAKPAAVDLTDARRIVCLRIRAYSTYNVYAEPDAGPKRHIIRMGKSPEIAVAVARLIAQMAPSIRVDIDI